METKTTGSETALRLVRRYPAPPNRVFDALTKPDLLSRWFAPSDDFDAVVDRFEAEVGGSYRIEMRNKDGNVHTCIGKVQEVDAPNRLVYTWRWEGGAMGEMPDTLVTWELQPVGNGTELVLIHERFPNEEAKGQHEQGWNGCMERLARLF